MSESMKPNFASLDHKALALLANDLWDQLQELRQERERLRLEILNLRKQIVDDWK